MAVPQLFAKETTFGSGAAAASSSKLLSFLANPFVGIGISLGLSWLSRIIRKRQQPLATAKAAVRKTKIEPAVAQTIIGDQGVRAQCVPVYDESQWASRSAGASSGRVFDYGFFVSEGYIDGLMESPSIYIDGQQIYLRRLNENEVIPSEFPRAPLNARVWTNANALPGRGSSLTRSYGGGRIAQVIFVYEYIEGGEWSSLVEASREFDDADRKWPVGRSMDNISGLHVRLWEMPFPEGRFRNETAESRQNIYNDWITNKLWPSTDNATCEIVAGGIKITWPGQTEPRATSNAAALRWWWMTTYRGIPPEQIDRKSVEDAINYCGETIKYYMDNRYLSEYAPAQEGQRYIPSMRYSMNGIIFSDDNADAVEDEMDFTWMGRVAREDGAYVFRPGQQREPIHHLDETLFGDQAVLQTGGYENAITRGVKGIMAQNQYDDDRLPQSSSTAIIHGQETLPGEIVDIGERAFVSDPWLMDRNCEYTLRILRETRRAIVTIPARKKLILRGIRVGDPVSIHSPDILAYGNTWIVNGRETIKKDKSLRLVLQPDIDWDEPAIAPPLKRAYADDSAGTGGTEPTDPTNPNAPTEPSGPQGPPVEQ